MVRNERLLRRGLRLTAKEPSRWVVYLLRCCDNTFYTGITNDLERRIAAHNAGRGARYTRGRRPVNLAYVEECGSKGDALRREAALRKLGRTGKTRIVQSTAARKIAAALEE